MIVGLGTDLIEIARIDQVIARHGERFLTRYFQPDEITYCTSHRSSGERFAARWAAKEAVLKALGTGHSGAVRLEQVEVIRHPSGAPSVRLHEAAQQVAERLGVARWHLSLSHHQSSALAFAIAEA